MRRHKILIALTLIALLSAIGAGVAIAVSGNRDAQADVIIQEGETYKIALDENPSTGYCWIVSNPDYSIVTITGDYFEEINPELGAPGKHVWKVEGLKKGIAELTFKYKKPWEKDAIETKVLSITVE
jgi:inhibitor of cysteine peptidase